MKGLEKVERSSVLTLCRTRLAILFFSHEVKQVEALIPETHPIRRGQTRTSVALDEITRFCGLDRQRAKDLWKRRSAYIKLVVNGGPGILLQLVCRYRKEELEDIEIRSRRLDFVAACTIIRGLLAYGWTNNELAHSRSDLVTTLSKYICLEALTQGEIQKRGNRVDTRLAHVCQEGLDLQSRKRRRVLREDNQDVAECHSTRLDEQAITPNTEGSNQQGEREGSVTEAVGADTLAVMEGGAGGRGLAPNYSLAGVNQQSPSSGLNNPESESREYVQLSHYGGDRANDEESRRTLGERDANTTRQSPVEGNGNPLPGGMPQGPTDGSPRCIDGLDIPSMCMQAYLIEQSGEFDLLLLNSPPTTSHPV
ncbi:hypothetical protein BCR34DRAFT_90040 [Clohesyomyces aquaticus]|uniref:Uncharacterized protein n=1 Tax=Clohesyomyces aquaticus TaxID=1231657 RepID=A0A1Y1YVM6_9PLEO|nr:hypothetical protein BCR34DRAFT_90040 [Clohesyomyces aquaticus]